MNDIPSNVKVNTGNLLLQLIATPFAEVKKEVTYGILFYEFCV